MGAGYDPCPRCGCNDDFEIIQMFSLCRECLKAELKRLRLENNRLHTECGHLQADVQELQDALACYEAAQPAAEPEARLWNPPEAESFCKDHIWWEDRSDG